MIRNIILIASVIVVPLLFWYAKQYGDIQSITFQKAFSSSEQSADTEQATKVKIDATIIIDSENTIFKIEYTGKDQLPTFTQAFPVSVFGHVHNGEPPYVHASQIIGH
jgi:hypothetical protein